VDVVPVSPVHAVAKFFFGEESVLSVESLYGCGFAVLRNVGADEPSCGVVGVVGMAEDVRRGAVAEGFVLGEDVPGGVESADESVASAAEHGVLTDHASVGVVDVDCTRGRVEALRIVGFACGEPAGEGRIPVEGTGRGVEAEVGVGAGDETVAVVVDSLLKLPDGVWELGVEFISAVEIVTEVVCGAKRVAERLELGLGGRGDGGEDFAPGAVVEMEKPFPVGHSRGMLGHETTRAAVAELGGRAARHARLHHPPEGVVLVAVGLFGEACRGVGGVGHIR